MQVEEGKGRGARELEQPEALAEVEDEVGQVGARELHGHEQDQELLHRPAGEQQALRQVAASWQATLSKAGLNQDPNRNDLR